MREVAFNLLDEPWIRVMRKDCGVEEVSLTDALLHAHEFTDLAGELPTQDVAVLRLLLAVLHTVFSRVDEEGQPAPFQHTDEALLRWRALWERGCFPQGPIRHYLTKWHERFWLFHPQRPFYQVPEAKIGTEFSASKLNGELSEGSNKPRLFKVCSGIGQREMTYAQAARWLLYINGFDDVSAKPKGKGLPSMSTGWLGQLGLIVAQGSNLFETMMLNLTLLQNGETLWNTQRPCWELEEVRSKERTEIALPDNASELLTLQSRRLLLHRKEEKVIGYALLGGDFFNKENAFCEQMTVWRASQDKKSDPLVYRPRKHDSSKQFWQEFPAVFAPDEGQRMPGVVEWITQLQTNHLLDRQTMIRFRIAATQYSDTPYYIVDTFSDQLSFHARLLGQMGIRWRTVIKEEIRRCERTANEVGKLAQNLLTAAGGENVQRAKQVRQQFYFQMDQPFRQWLYTIDPDWDEIESEQRIRSWEEQVQQTARTLGRTLVEETGPLAFRGRMVKTKKNGKETSLYYAAPKAYRWFLAGLRKIYEEGGGPV